jgi:hypothetical protein
VFLYNVQCVQNIDGIVYASLYVFENWLIIVPKVKIVLFLVLLHRLEVVELFQYIIGYLCTGHVIWIWAIFVILIVVHQIVDTGLFVLFQTKLSNPLDHCLWVLEMFLALRHDLSRSLVSLEFFDITSRFIFLLLLTVRIVETFWSSDLWSLCLPKSVHLLTLFLFRWADPQVGLILLVSLVGSPRRRFERYKETQKYNIIQPR